MCSPSSRRHPRGRAADRRSACRQGNEPARGWSLAARGGRSPPRRLWWMSGTLAARARAPSRGHLAPRLMYVLGAGLLSVFSLTDEIERRGGAHRCGHDPRAHARPATAAERSLAVDQDTPAEARSSVPSPCAAAVLHCCSTLAPPATKGATPPPPREALAPVARPASAPSATPTAKGRAQAVVRRLAGDLHALVSAELGDWGFVAIAEDAVAVRRRCSSPARRGHRAHGRPARRDCRRSRSRGQAVLTILGRFVIPLASRAASRPPASPLADMVAMQASPGSSAPDGPGWGHPVSFEVAQEAGARGARRAVSRRARVAVHEQFLVLGGASTRLLSARSSPMTVIPARSMRADDRCAVAAMQEDVAQGHLRSPAPARPATAVRGAVADVRPGLRARAPPRSSRDSCGTISTLDL